MWWLQLCELEATVSPDCRSFTCSSRSYTASVECALTFESILALIKLVYWRLTACQLPIAIFKFNVLSLLFAKELQAGTNFMHHATFHPMCYCPITQRRQQAILNDLNGHVLVACGCRVGVSTHAAWLHCMCIAFGYCCLVTLLLYVHVHVLVNMSAYMYLQVATISYIVHCIFAVELVGQQYNGQHSTIFVALMTESCAVLLLSICSTLCGHLKLLSIL